MFSAPDVVSPGAFEDIPDVVSSLSLRRAVVFHREDGDTHVYAPDSAWCGVGVRVSDFKAANGAGSETEGETTGGGFQIKCLRGGGRLQGMAHDLVGNEGGGQIGDQTYT